MPLHPTRPSSTSLMMAVLMALLTLLLRGVSAACYMPNQTAQISDYSPCYAFHSDNSFCCANHKTITTGDPNEHDNCLPNGLCQWIFNGQTQYWREGCSNASWPSEWCLAGICGDGDEIDDNGNAQLTPCENSANSTTWCCGQNNTACCGTPSEITLAPTIAGFAALASSSGLSLTSTSPLTSSNGTASTTPTHQSQAHSGLSSGAKAGIGVGVALGVIALAFALGLLVMMLRRHRAGYAQPPGSYDAGGYSPAETYDLKEAPIVDTNPPDGVAELASGTEDVRVELDAPRKPIEMPGGGGEASKTKIEDNITDEPGPQVKREPEATTDSTA